MLEYPEKKPVAELRASADLNRNSYHSVNYYVGGMLLAGDNLPWLHVLSKNYSEAIDLVYIDPPFNTCNNFFYNDSRSSHVSPSHNAAVAYEDDMPFESYLEFMRERLYAIKDLLTPEGTLYLHIDIKVGHYIKVILDEVFGMDNFINEITRIKSNPKNFNRKAYGNEKDVIYVYSRARQKNIFNDVRDSLTQAQLASQFPRVDAAGRKYTTIPCHAPGETKNGATGGLWRDMAPPPGRHWRCSPQKLELLNEQGLIEWSATGIPRIKKFADEHGGKKIQDVWHNFKDPPYPCYPTEKNSDMLELIVRQSSNRNSLVLDAFCGSGTFLAAALRHGRRAIGIDKSDIALKVARKREELNNARIFFLDEQRLGL